jgi:uncharacterized protein YqjF (DUF2071 family)
MPRWAETGQAAVLSERAHRPWPVPDAPWVMAQTWLDLLFAHWRLPPEALRPHLPAALPIDTFHGSAWLGITPFEVSGLRPRGLPPLPRLSRFPELNVRTYTTLDGKPGIWFFSLDAGSLIAVEAARRTYKLPYFHARMKVERRGGSVGYLSSRRDAARPFVLEAEYRGEDVESTLPQPGSLEHFLTERYCLYAHDDNGLHRADIHHTPWLIRPAEVRLDLNTMPPDGIELEGEPLCHLAERQDVVIWPLECVQQAARPASNRHPPGKKPRNQEE